MTGMDFQAFGETQYDILAAELQAFGYEENLSDFGRGIKMKVELENVKPMDIEKEALRLSQRSLEIPSDSNGAGGKALYPHKRGF